MRENVASGSSANCGSSESGGTSEVQRVIIADQMIKPRPGALA